MQWQTHKTLEPQLSSFWGQKQVTRDSEQHNTKQNELRNQWVEKQTSPQCVYASCCVDFRRNWAWVLLTEASNFIPLLQLTMQITLCGLNCIQTLFFTFQPRPMRGHSYCSPSCSSLLRMYMYVCTVLMFMEGSGNQTSCSVTLCPTPTVNIYSFLSRCHCLLFSLDDWICSRYVEVAHYLYSNFWCNKCLSRALFSHPHLPIWKRLCLVIYILQKTSYLLSTGPEPASKLRGFKPLLHPLINSHGLSNGMH